MYQQNQISVRRQVLKNLLVWFLIVPYIQVSSDKGCPVCREGMSVLVSSSVRFYLMPTVLQIMHTTIGLQFFGYRDVLLLRQFLTPEGLILGRRHTRICPKLQRRVAKCIKRSRKMGS